jgi:cell division protein ZapA
MEQIDVKILEREYRLAVNTDDKPQLLEAVKLVDDRMRVIREGGRVTGMDRIAVMAALQLAHELVTNKVSGGGAAAPSAPSNDMLKRLQRMNAELDQELKRQESLF